MIGGFYLLRLERVDSKLRHSKLFNESQFCLFNKNIPSLRDKNINDAILYPSNQLAGYRLFCWLIKT